LILKVRQVKPRGSSLRRIEKFVGNPAWDEFVAWCRHKKLNAVPANAWTLAAYIRSLEGFESLSKIKKRVTDIGKAHAEKSKRRPERDPLIAKTFHILELGGRKQKPKSTVFDDTAYEEETPASRPSVSTNRKKTKTRTLRSTPKLVSKRAAKKS